MNLVSINTVVDSYVGIFLLKSSYSDIACNKIGLKASERLIKILKQHNISVKWIITSIVKWNMNSMEVQTPHPFKKKKKNEKFYFTKHGNL